DALRLRGAGGVRGKLHDVHPRRGVSRGKGGDGRAARQAFGQRADVRLHPDRSDQRRLRRPVPRRHVRQSLGAAAFSLAAQRRRAPDLVRFLSLLIAMGITIYFWRINIIGIHESSAKAMRIMQLTTVMGVIVVAWASLTVAFRPELRHLPPFHPLLTSES